MRIERLGPDRCAAAVPDLAVLLVDCVAAGANIGFLAGLDHGQAARWWEAALAEDGWLTLVARDGDGPVLGVVRLRPVTMPNGTHRADVSKLLVGPADRGRGIAGALLDRLEDEARALGRTLLVLDTATGSAAEGFYRRRGWRVAGVIEDYAATPSGRLAATTVMSKRLAPVRSTGGPVS